MVKAEEDRMVQDAGAIRRVGVFPCFIFLPLCCKMNTSKRYAKGGKEDEKTIPELDVQETREICNGCSCGMLCCRSDVIIFHNKKIHRQEQ